MLLHDHRSYVYCYVIGMLKILPRLKLQLSLFLSSNKLWILSSDRTNQIAFHKDVHDDLSKMEYQEHLIYWNNFITFCMHDNKNSLFIQMFQVALQVSRQCMIEIIG